MRHPLMIMMTMARALSQWVIRTVKGWTITFETRCRRPAVMSVIVTSQRALFVDRHEAGRFERRLCLRGFQERHEGLCVQGGIAGLCDNVLDRRLARGRKRRRQWKARQGVAGIDDPELCLAGSEEAEHAGRAFGDHNGLVAIVDRNSN